MVAAKPGNTGRRTVNQQQEDSANHPRLSGNMRLNMCDDDGAAPQGPMHTGAATQPRDRHAPLQHRRPSSVLLLDEHPPCCDRFYADSSNVFLRPTVRQESSTLSQTDSGNRLSIHLFIRGRPFFSGLPAVPGPGGAGGAPPSGPAPLPAGGPQHAGHDCGLD